MRTSTSSDTAGANMPALKSLRSRVVVASKPSQGLFSIGWVPCWFSVVSSTTSLVTPFRVRSPVISAVVSPVTSMPVDLKVTSGAAPSAPKKSGDRKCSSRPAKPVISEATGNVASTEDAAGSSASNMIVPVMSPNMPVVVEKPRWL